MLLAAQLSSEPEHQDNQDKLYKASRIQDFLDSIRESLINYGAIRRSQTFLSSTVGAISKPDEWITQQKQAYQEFSNTLKSKQEKIRDDLRKAKRDSCEYLEQEISAIFQDVSNSIPKFAETNWSANEQELNNAWKQHIKDISLEKRIQISNEETLEKANHAVREILEEVGKDLHLTAKLNLSGFKLNSYDPYDDKNFFKIGGGIIALVGAGLIFIVPPVGIAVSLIGAGLSFISNWFTSKVEKRRQAVEKISNSLREQTNTQKNSISDKSLQNLEKYCRDTLVIINSYFQELTEGLDDISNRLEKAQNSLDATVNYLNFGYAKRVIDWSTEQYEPLTIVNVKQTIAKVDRKFGHIISIKTKTVIELKKPLEEIKQVIQEDISIENNQ